MDGIGLIERTPQGALSQMCLVLSLTCLSEKSLFLLAVSFLPCELSFIAEGNAKWYSHFGRQFDSFSQNETNMLLTLEPAIVFLHSYPNRKLRFTQKPACGYL